jgi:hypothetical protein
VPEAKVDELAFFQNILLNESISLKMVFNGLVLEHCVIFPEKKYFILCYHDTWKFIATMLCSISRMNDC